VTDMTVNTSGSSKESGPGKGSSDVPPSESPFSEQTPSSPPDQHGAELHVGSALRALRKARGLSQVKLAEKLNITFQQIQKYERGENRISAGKLHILAQTLGVTVADFFAGLERPLTSPVPPVLWAFASLPGAVEFMHAAMALPPTVRAELFKLACELDAPEPEALSPR
jgi:transcriptional regulator with XRE-family HTH domain